MPHTPTLSTPPSRGNRAKQLSVTIDRDTLADIDRAAAAENITRSQWIRERLEWALEDEA